MLVCAPGDLWPKIAHIRGCPECEAEIQSSDLRVSKVLSGSGSSTKKVYNLGKAKTWTILYTKGTSWQFCYTEKVSDTQCRYRKVMKTFQLWSQANWQSSPDLVTCNMGDLKQATCPVWALVTSYESLSVITVLPEWWWPSRFSIT